MRSICMCTGAIRILQLITRASDWSLSRVFNRQQHFLPSDRSCRTTHRARLLCNSCGTALTEFSLSRHVAVLLVPPQHCCSRCNARARAHARTHVEKIKCRRHRPGSAFHDTPRRHAPLEKRIDGGARQRRGTQVRWEPKKLLPILLLLHF
jgi:hypothetical protein